MRLRLFSFLVVAAVFCSTSVQKAEAQPSNWIKSLGFTSTAFPGFDFQEWDYSLIPSTTIWVAMSNNSPVVFGGRTILPMIPYPACGGFLPYAFVANYFNGFGTSAPLIGTRYECAFTNSVFIDLTQVGLGVQRGTKYCSGVCP